MDLILVHLGDSIPAYMDACVEQIRLFTDTRIIVAISNDSAAVDLLRHKNVIVVPAGDIKPSENMKFFHQIGHFGKYDPFWKYACQRLYVIESLMAQMQINQCLHIENDNLIYGVPDEKYLADTCKNTVGLPRINEQMLSAGIMYVGALSGLVLMNAKMNDLTCDGHEKIAAKYGPTMLNEMRLMGIIQETHPSAITVLPTFPVPGSNYVYDCASWGQYVGGTHQNQDFPFAHNSHTIGRQIMEHKWDVVWENHDGKQLPFVVDLLHGRQKPLYNLHIHCKSLNNWKSNTDKKYWKHA